MKHYVYRITNIVDDKHYIGVRSSKNPESDLGILYLSSSTDEEFISEQREHPERFAYNIMKTFSTRKEAVALEIDLHNLYDVAVNDQFYNRAKQTSTGFCRLGTTFNHTEEAIRKISESKTGALHPLWGISPSDETRAKMSESRIGEKHFMWGKNHSEETKDKISDTLTGRTLSEETKTKISNTLKGRVFSDETKAKMSSRRKGVPKTEEHRRKMSETVSAKAIESAYRFIVYDSCDNIIHDEVIVSFKRFCHEHGYQLGNFGKSHRTQKPISSGRFKGWRVQRLTRTTDVT